MICSKTVESVSNSVGSDQMQHSVASDLGLYYCIGLCVPLLG